MGADQHVQRGHAVHLVGKAVLLRQIRRHGLLLREAVEIAPAIWERIVTSAVGTAGTWGAFTVTV